MAVLAAIVLTLMITATAFSVDTMGRVMGNRQDQATADLAALDSSWGLASCTTQSLATASAARNGVITTAKDVSVVATPGTYTNGSFSPSACGSGAVKVTVSSPYNDFFGGTFSQLSRSAIATDSGKAQFSVGATLIDVKAGLGPFGSANLALVGYQGLASGNVTLGALATQLGFSALTPDQVLASSVTVGQLLTASAGLLTSSGNPTAAAALTTLVGGFGGSFNSTNTITLGQALDLQQGTGVGLGTGINLLQMVQGGIQLANQKAGISLGLSASALGLASVSASLSALVPATMSPYGPIGVSATNTQVTVNVTVGVSVLGLVTVDVPLTITLGGAAGTLTGINCTSGSPTSITVAATLNAASVSVNDAGIAVIGLTVASATGGVSVTNSTSPTETLTEPTNFVFNPPNNSVLNASPTPQTISISATGAQTTSNLSLSVLGLPLLVSGALLNSTLNSALLSAVPTIVNNISSVVGGLGINVDSADYLGNKAACSIPTLVK
jgi:uncharacterized membrane protein